MVLSALIIRFVAIGVAVYESHAERSQVPLV